MRVLQMLQMLQRFFALATHKGKFETEEDFADTIVPCYDWIAWRAFSPSITHAVHGIRTGCTFCDGHVPLKHKKNTEAGWKLCAFCNKRKVPLIIPRPLPSRNEQKKHGTIIYFRWAYHALYSFRQSYFLSKSPSNVLISANGSA